ncbi:HCL352Wp [Eremothecium sinecaudum]|uniref:HCL352Wp n=1 Tax=Eremothecium sinecaudum TaxID=45286 RepID=A0A120K1V8_9SACH|nr:HCL352Wp [Eremothecium sinecaudum]AMD19799.1 HCL352Wp [Eremothecium sinecaudum]
MDHTRTHTNTPPAETIALKSDPTAAGVTQPPESSSSSASSDSSDAMTTGGDSPQSNPPSGSSSATGSDTSLQQPDPTQHITDYVQDVRSLNAQGCITPAEQEASQRTTSQQHSVHGHSGRQHHSQQGASFNPALSYNSSTIFKPFDMKTGQFMPNLTPATAVTQGGSNPSEVVMAVSSATSTSREHHVRPADQKVAVHHRRLKFRSHSVPTILHSSLRRLDTHQLMVSSTEDVPSASSSSPPSSGKQQPFHPSNIVFNSSMNNASLSSTSQVAGIKKKKHQGKGTQLSLRNAILMSHRLQSINGQEVSMEERIQYIKSYPGPMPLPPINLQCLKEIDLSEIVKNPQLRHDIVFDPLLQFRPNLDGERGVKKRQLADKYWADVENEILVYNENPKVFDYRHTRLVPLFDTLKDVLITIVPQKEISTVENVLDTELLIQELLRGSLVMTNLSEWLAQLFKHHCAPMRDPWVDSMQKKFKEAQEEQSVSKLGEGLKLVFQILEAMKLDIANHQIRILRPALLSNAVDFEKQYFQSLMNSQRVNLKASLKWFRDKYDEACKSGFIASGKPTKVPDVYRLCIKSIISLLSCRKMVGEYPTSLSFDHARLILLRADIRQAVCLLVCKLLFKQLVANDNSFDRAAKEFIIANYSNKRLKEEIVSIITDEHGNCRWTKNTMSIAIHLCNIINELKQEYETFKELNLRQSASPMAAANTAAANTQQTTTKFLTLSKTLTPLDSKTIAFAKSWLSKQTQPLSEVYGVLENRVFNSLEESIFQKSCCTKDGTVKQDFINLCNSSGNQGIGTSAIIGAGTAGAMSAATLNASPSHHKPLEGKIGGGISANNSSEGSSSMTSLDMDEFESLNRHLYTVVNFHWSVFGCHYVDSLGDLVEKA